MHNEMIDWIAARAIEAIKAGNSFPENAAYELGGMPFVDPLRKLVERDRAEMKPHILRLIRDDKWWHRYLGTNIARPYVAQGDEDVAGAVLSQWEQEPHFHTKLAMIYLLMHRGISDQHELVKIIGWLEQNRNQFLPSIHKFYEKHPRGTWGGLCERLADPKFAGARPIYLLSLALLAEADGEQPQDLPAVVDDLAQSENAVERNLVVRLQKAIKGHGG